MVDYRSTNYSSLGSHRASFRKTKGFGIKATPSRYCTGFKLAQSLRSLLQKAYNHASREPLPPDLGQPLG
jgi:hypothetical protein